jgi:hypothetical protein
MPSHPLCWQTNCHASPSGTICMGIRPRGRLSVAPRPERCSPARPRNGRAEVELHAGRNSCAALEPGAAGVGAHLGLGERVGQVPVTAREATVDDTAERMRVAGTGLTVMAAEAVGLGSRCSCIRRSWGDAGRRRRAQSEHSRQTGRWPGWSSSCSCLHRRWKARRQRSDRRGPDQLFLNTVRLPRGTGWCHVKVDAPRHIILKYPFSQR